MSKTRRALHIRDMHTAMHEAHPLRPGVRAKQAEAAARAVNEAASTPDYMDACEAYWQLMDESGAVEIDYRLVDRDRNTYDEDDGRRFRFVNIGSIDLY